MSTDAQSILFETASGGVAEIDPTTGAAMPLSPPGANPSGLGPTNYLPFSGGLLFSGVDASGNDQLWFWDGATSISEIPVGGAASTGLGPGNFASYGGNAYFTGYDSNLDVVLWSYDGSAASAVALPGSGNTDIGDVAAAAGALYIDAVDTSGVSELWQYTGTSETDVTADYAAASGGIDPSGIFAFAAGVIFTGIDTNGATAVFYNNGTVGGTSELSFGGMSPDNFTVYDGEVYFSAASPGGSSSGLWVTDGTSGGTRQIAIPGAAALADPGNFAVGNGVLYFIATDQTGTQQLYSYDGSAVSEIGGASGLQDFGIVTACFASGTRILTAGGEVPVEQLAIGARIPTLQGQRFATVRWIGHRTLDLARTPAAMPVRIRAGAFADAVPLRNLLLSPDHAVYADGVLVPVRHLINDASIATVAMDRVTYWHVELDRHDVLFAEGMPAESFLDTGNRSAFANASVVDLAASLDRGAEAAWAEASCARLVEDGPLLAGIRGRLARRAAAIAAVADPVQEIVLDAAGVAVAQIAPGAVMLRLVSPAGRAPGDARRCGALIRAIRLDGAAVPLDDARLVRGFNEIEQHGGVTVRWTDGAGVIALGAGTAARRIELDTVAVWRAPAAAAPLQYRANAA